MQSVGSINIYEQTSQTTVPREYLLGISSRISPGNHPDSIAYRHMGAQLINKQKQQNGS